MDPQVDRKTKKHYISVYLSSSLTSCFILLLGMTEPVDITDNGDGTHTVMYTPAKDGPYSVCVKYADQEVPRR